MASSAFVIPRKRPGVCSSVMTSSSLAMISIGALTAGNARYRDWAGRLERHTASPGAVETMTRATLGYDVRPLLSELNISTLVVHRRDDPRCGRRARALPR